MKKNAIRLSPDDNVAVLLNTFQPGAVLMLEDGVKISLKTVQPIPFGHKVAIRVIKAGDKVFKYGYPIGLATAEISIGEHVHTHNVKGLRVSCDDLP